MGEEQKTLRLFFVDNIRILLTILVIMHHTMITYGAEGSWYFLDPHTDELTSTLLTVIATLDQGFFMGLFFFISAYFVPGSYNRKGPKLFLKDRLIRLGIPLALYIIFVNPYLVYLINVTPKSGKTYFEFYLGYFQSLDAFLSFLGGNGPLWFVLALLIYDFVYTFCRIIYKKSTKSEPIKKRPTNGLLAIVTVIMAIFTFIVRLFYYTSAGDDFFNIQLCFVAQYIVMLLLGTIAYNRDWFRNITDRQGKFWIEIALIAIIIFFPIGLLLGAYGEDADKFIGGLNWQALVFNLWESFYCMGMCIGLVVLFRKKYNSQGKVAKTLSQNAYTIYIVHAPVLIGVGLLFYIVPMFALLKFIIVFPIVLFICFLLSHFVLRRIPGAKRVLG